MAETRKYKEGQTDKEPVTETEENAGEDLRSPAERALSDEVALELSKVEWPSRDMVRRSTTIVVLATIGSSLAFWLYDIGANHAIGFIADSPKTWIVLLKVLVGAVAIYIIRALG